jgi:hypothetical protein
VSLPKFQSKGFHQIVIAPTIAAKSTSNLSDLRLFDDQKIEVPFMLRKDFERKQHHSFNAHRIVSESKVGKYATEVILQNQSGRPINNLSVFLNNAEVSKEIIISGSYDQKQWYAVKQCYNLSGIAGNNSVMELNTIYFPLSDYPYFKIHFNDKYTLPVKVLKVGYYSDSLSFGNEISLPKPHIIRTEKSSEHLTCVQLNFDGYYAIDIINLKISAPTLYRRNVSVYALKNDSLKTEKILLQQTTLTPVASNRILLDEVYEKQLILEIENDNNPLLSITEIDCSQMAQYLIAYIEKPGNYSLQFGNKNIAPPVYDLTFFNHLIPAKMPVIETAGLSIIKHPTQPVKRKVEPFFYNKKFFLWTVIVVVALLLMLLSSKMLNEMNKNKK